MARKKNVLNKTIDVITKFIDNIGKSLSNPFSTLLLGLFIGFISCLVFLYFPLSNQSKERELSHQERAAINRSERAVIKKMNTLSEETMTRWVATLDEQNVRYAELQSELGKPGNTPIWVVLLAFVVAVGFVAWMMRDSNSQALQTMDNAVLLLPTLRKLLPVKEGLTVDVAKEYESLRSPEKSVAAIEDQQTKNGKIVELRSGDKSGYIKADQGGKKLFFHVNENVNLKNRKLQSGMRVAFSLGEDRKGRSCAQNVEILD